MTIICGILLDGTGQTDQSTLAVALGLAARTNSRHVLAVHVVEGKAHDASVLSAAEAKLTHLISEAAIVPHAQHVQISQRVLVGPIAASLAGLAETERATAIVVAAHQRFSQPGLGSVAAELLTLAPVPAVLVRDPQPWLDAFAGKKQLRILIGVDGSSVCDVALSWVHALNGAVAMHVCLGAVYYADDAAKLYGLSVGNMVDRNPELEGFMSRDMLRRFNAPSPRPGQAELTVSAHPTRGLGRIGDHLLDIANEQHCDVVIVGTSQKTGLGKLGSVSSAVVSGASQSVTCIPPTTSVAMHAAAPMRSVVVATDNSAFANRAVPYAYAIVGSEPNAHVHIVYVLDSDDNSDSSSLRAELQRLIPVDCKAESTIHLIKSDETAAAISSAAARLGVDAICIASHGRTGIARALVGSVADQILRQTRLPVMVIRPSS
jgi:nucleotide-binding universal stress UspA family protein